MSQNPTKVEVKKLRAMLQAFNEETGRYINEQERYKLGRVLTIIDASFSDPEQRKAVKDLVQNEWWNSGARLHSADESGNPHDNIRGLTQALGFELYEYSDPSGVLAPVEKNWHEERARERYQALARLQDEADKDAN